MSILSNSRMARRHGAKVKYRFAQRSKLSRALENLESRVMMSIVPALIQPASDSVNQLTDFTESLTPNQFDNSTNILLGAHVDFATGINLKLNASITNPDTNTTDVTGFLNASGSSTIKVPGTASFPAAELTSTASQPNQNFTVQPGDPTLVFNLDLTDPKTGSINMTPAQAAANGYVGAGTVAGIEVSASAVASFFTQGPANRQVSGDWETRAAGSVDVSYFYITPGSISGLKFNDLDGVNGQGGGEGGLSGWTINLVGQEDDVVDPLNNANVLYTGQAVATSTVTGAGGTYSFNGLKPGTYTVSEVQQAGWTQTFGSTYTVILGADGQATAQSPSDNTGNDFGNHQDQNGNGAAATIGFWHNKNGRAVITSAAGTSLTTWLSTNFPNLYGNLAGKQSLAVFNLFTSASNGYFGAKGAKFSAQVLATALAVYFDSVNNTSQAQKFGFGGDLGSVLMNVGNNGAAFNVANGSDITIFNALKAVDSHTVNGVIATQFRGAYNSFFDNINNVFDIP